MAGAIEATCPHVSPQPRLLAAHAATAFPVHSLGSITGSWEGKRVGSWVGRGRGPTAGWSSAKLSCQVDKGTCSQPPSPHSRFED